MTTTATCRTCGWTAPAGDWAAIDSAAEKHAKKPGHPVVTVTVPDRQEERK